MPSLLMQKMGVEPTRYCYHTDLNRARLPIPPLLRTVVFVTEATQLLYDMWEDLSTVFLFFYFIYFFAKIHTKCKRRRHIVFVSLVQKMGVEPTRYCYHTDLNRARLPIPPLLQTIPLVLSL